jgi:glycosyltransferase involved in cell wall biosynthesis
MDYRPNIEGVCWFARHVWPDLRRDFPTLAFIIVGRDPAGAVRKLTEMPGIAVTGPVPDVRPYLAPPAIVVIPLRIARGIQNKVLEAMAMARPVVASGGALEGLEVDVGRDVLRADTPQQWGREIRRLLAEHSLREALGQRARACVVQKYTWQARLKPFVDLCERLCGGDPATGGRPAEPPTPATTLDRPDPCRVRG